MKHYNIPIFLPELACPFRCVYCNQYSITGKAQPIGTDEVKSIIDKHLASFRQKERFVEVAFFGGNFTGLPEKLQDDYLAVVQPYLEKGLVNGIRCSTRPDYITTKRVKLLKKSGMLSIELGAQSTDDEILKKCHRGHTFNDIVNASETILSEGITLGLQMMIGLPFDSFEKDMRTAEDIVRLGAKETRIYPCITLKDTALERLYLAGKYQPLSLEDAVSQSAKIYRYFIENDVNVLRIGLHASEDLNGAAYVAGPYHNNFAEMTLSRFWKSKIESGELKELPKDVSVNHIIGWKGENKELLKEKGLWPYKKEKTFIVSEQIPEEALEKLKTFGKVIVLRNSKSAYYSISTHPDIFIHFINENEMVCAPNVPKKWLQMLKKANFNVIEGKKEIGKKYPETVPYNVVGIGKTLIHNTKYTEETIASHYKDHIHVNQGYTRCNLLALNENNFITSDEGIVKILKDKGFNVLYVNPRQIRLLGQDYGFFPGCCGVFDKKLFVCGSTKNLNEKNELDNFLQTNDIELVELYEDELTDIGSIL